jgi:hypothetical protein
MTAPAALPTAIRLPHNRYLRRLVDQLPGYTDALSLAEHADECLSELPPVPPVPAELDPHTSGQITAEWLSALDTHEQAQAQYVKDRARIQAVKSRAQSTAASALNTNVNRLFRGLNDDLTRLLAEVAEIAQELDGASSPSQAIGRGVVEPWKRLCDLADDYSTLRSAQDYLLVSVAPKSYWQSCRPILGGEDTASLAHIRNLDDIYPSWRNLGAAQRVNVDGSKDRAEPWPADPTQLLLWLVASDAEPWIPTTTEIDELFRERRDRDNQPRQPQPARQTLNQPPRADYYSRIMPDIKPSTKKEQLI